MGSARVSFPALWQQAAAKDGTVSGKSTPSRHYDSSGDLLPPEYVLRAGPLWYSGAYCLCAGRHPPERAQEYVCINCRRYPMLYDLNQGNVTSGLISRSGLPSPAVLPTARCGGAARSIRRIVSMNSPAKTDVDRVPERTQMLSGNSFKICWSVGCS